MDATHVTYQNAVDGFRVKYDLCIPNDLALQPYPADANSNAAVAEFDQHVEQFLREYGETVEEIERLTNSADGIDYAIAVSAGIVAGIIDAVFVKEWDFQGAKAVSNEEINKKVIEFAKKHGMEEWAKKYGKDPERLETAIQFLESRKEFKLPGDGAYQAFSGKGVTNATHHLDDFCHHPTLIGLACCILVQFTGEAKYHPSIGGVIKTPIEVNQYGNFVSEERWGKVFAGIINWFFKVAKTKEMQKGHLFSDMAGSSGSSGKGNDGMGIPGTFLSVAKELSLLPCFKDTKFAENLRKAFQNGIGEGKAQLDLGAFNSLFSGASSKLDMRTEMAIGKELKRQSIPVKINEMVVRSLYFVRRFILQMKDKESILELDWKPLLPIRNRTIVRMLTISTGTLTTIDLGDAAIHAAVKSAKAGTPVAFLPNFVLRVNFVGIARFSIACTADLIMEIEKDRLELAATSGDIAIASLTEIDVINGIEDMQNKTREHLAQVSAEIDAVSRLKF